MFRTRFKKAIVAEFVDPSRPQKKQKLIILCDGMPSIPRKQRLVEFLAAKGFWVIYSRYRGAWESGGEFLERAPHEDILDILDHYPLNLGRLPSVSVCTWHRIRSLPLAEVSAERRQFFYLWIYGSYEWWRIVRLWTGAI